MTTQLNKTRTLTEALIDLHLDAEPITKPHNIVKHIKGNYYRYLSGSPYLWSDFTDRAFEFANAQMAIELIQEFPELAGAEPMACPKS